MQRFQRMYTKKSLSTKEMLNSYKVKCLFYQIVGQYKIHLPHMRKCMGIMEGYSLERVQERLVHGEIVISGCLFYPSSGHFIFLVADVSLCGDIELDTLLSVFQRGRQTTCYLCDSIVQLWVRSSILVLKRQFHWCGC